MGGTFDPVHVGHLVAAMEVRHALGLDRVLLVVANVPWQKRGARHVTPAADRLAVVAAAVDGVDGLEASDLEIGRGGDSFTADTLEALAAEAPAPDLFLVVGDDVAGELHTWSRPEVVRDLATVVVVNRPGAPPARLGPGWRHERVEVPGLDVSSSDLRARLAAGRPVDFLVPPAAIRCLHERGLYAAGNG
jgi:nicotinate-nucleotide adenylyltransferase